MYDSGKIQLGDTVRDSITGFTGVVTGIVFYISGCNQAVVTPRVAGDGKLDDGRWFDLQRLSVDDAIAPVTLDNSATPGFGDTPPAR